VGTLAATCFDSTGSRKEFAALAEVEPQELSGAGERAERRLVACSDGHDDRIRLHPALGWLDHAALQ
jgi:hypothetical protein